MICLFFWWFYNARTLPVSHRHQWQSKEDENFIAQSSELEFSRCAHDFSFAICSRFFFYFIWLFVLFLTRSLRSHRRLWFISNGKCNEVIVFKWNHFEFIENRDIWTKGKKFKAIDCDTIASTHSPILWFSCHTSMRRSFDFCCRFVIVVISYVAQQPKNHSNKRRKSLSSKMAQTIQQRSTNVEKALSKVRVKR